MRRKDKEITERNRIDEIIKEGEFLSLAMCEGNIPYVVPLNYGYDGKYIYFHCAKMGKKIDFIKQNDNISFSIVIKSDIVSDEEDCEWTCDYISVCGRGVAKILKDIDKKTHALDIIMKNYSDKQKYFYPASMVDRVCVVRIDMIEVTGKTSNIN